MNNADMPAMPMVNSDGFPTAGGFFESKAEGEYESIGLTKREHFAGLAMQGICASGPVISNKLIVIESLRLADALLAELDKEDK